MFVTDYVNSGSVASKVGLGTDVPSKIVRLPLAAYGGEVICQRGAFLAGSHTIDIQVRTIRLVSGLRHFFPAKIFLFFFRFHPSPCYDTFHCLGECSKVKGGWNRSYMMRTITILINITFFLLYPA